MKSGLVNYAIFGCGVMGRIHADAAAKDPASQVAYCVDIEQARADDLADRVGARGVTDGRIALQDPALDGVIVCLPHSLHREFCVEAAAAGKHVMVEKPISVSLDEADDMIAAENDVLLLVAHVLRLDGNFRRIKDLLDGGELGGPILARIHSEGFVSTSDEQYRYGAWYETPGEGGSALGGAIHQTDLMGWWLPRITKVTGFELSNRPEYQAIGEPDFNMIVYESESGALGETTYSYSSHQSAANDMPAAVVTFENGVVSVMANGEFRLYDSQDDPDGTRSKVSILPRESPARPASMEVPSFTKSILDGSPLFITAQEARRALELVLASRRSAQTRTTVDV